MAPMNTGRSATSSSKWATAWICFTFPLAVTMRKPPSKSAAPRARANVAQRVRTHQKPPILAVLPAQTRFGLSCSLRSYHPLPRSGHTVQVVRVDGSHPAPIPRLLRGEAYEVQVVLVEEFGVSIWSGRPRQRWNRIDDQFQIAFPAPERLLRALSRVDVGMQCVPARDTPVRIQREPANLKPSVNAIKTSNTHLDVVGNAQRHGSADGLNGARKIVWMNRIAGPPLFQLFQRPATVLEDLSVDGFDLTGRGQGGDQAGNAVHDQPRIALRFAQGFFRSPAFRNLLLQRLIGRGEFTRSLPDPFVKFIGDSPLFAQEACLLQPKGRLIRGDIQKKPLGLRRESEPLRAGDDNPDLALESKACGRDRKIDFSDGHAYAPKRFEWGISLQRLDHFMDASRSGDLLQPCTDSHHLGRRPPIRIVQPHEYEGEAEHLEQRHDQRADNSRRLAARPEGRKRHDIDQIAQTATESRDILDRRFDCCRNVRPSARCEWPASLAAREFRYEQLRRDVERIPLKNAADDDDRVRPHDVDDRVAPELGEVVCADHCVVMATPHFVDSRFELDHIVHLRSAVDDPFHVADDATERESSVRVAARQLLEHLQHSILVEAAVPKIGFDVRPQLELSARLCGGRVDPCGCQALQMVTALLRIDDVNRLVATLKPLLDERKQHAILLVLAVEECADMACFAELRAGKGNGRRVPLHGSSSGTDRPRRGLHMAKFSWAVPSSITPRPLQASRA